jgi:ABC-type Fe3+/spermidine/putrescine transport system ATPase subunit
MIELRDVYKSYGDFELKVSFQGPDSGILVLLGSSGSGKTTTLRMIAGFEQPDSGSILLDGQDITKVPVQKRAIGVVFQDYALFPHMNVHDNITYGLRAQGYSKADQSTRVKELLELTGLEGFGHRSITTLSGGEQQRVALARALAPNPKALLLDEPFSAVDPERRQELGSYLLRIQQQLNIPMVFVTHSRQEALALGHTIILLSQGQIVESGNPQDLYSRPRTAFGGRFLGSCTILTSAQWNQLGVGNSEPLSDSQTYLVRPEHVQIYPVSQSELALVEDPVVTGNFRVQPSEPSGNPGVVGVVLEKTFSGRGWEYQIRFSEITVQAFSSQDFLVGTRVRIQVQPEHLVLVKSN